MMHLLQMGPSKVLTTFPLQIQNSWQLSVLKLPPCPNTVTSSSDSNTYTSSVQSAPPPLLLMQHSCPTLVFKPPIPHLSILYSLPLPSHHRPLLLAVLLHLLLHSPLTLSGFPSGMLEIFEPGALNYFTFSQLTLSTLSVSWNPILTHLSLSGFLDSLLCALIAPTPDLAFSLLMPCTLVAVSSFCQAGPIFLWAFYVLSFFARSLLWLCRGQHLFQQLLLALIS